MAATNEFTYPYNPNGVLDECNITGETHTITPGTSANYNWFVPYAAPFFGFSVVLKHVASGKTLTRGVDYNLGLEYHQFNTQVTLRPVYGAIILIDTSLTGQFTLDYMTIGGQFAIDQNKALELMANAAIDPRTTRWDSVTDIPSQFPVTEHLHDVSDITGMADVVTAVQALTAAILDGNGKWFQSLNEHLNDFNDPHHVLDMISDGGTGESIAKSTQQQAIDGTDNASYMTPLRVAQYAAANVLNVIANHVADKTNPHGVTKAQVGLALVQNLALATKTDADGGTNLGNYATLDVAMYVAQLAVTAYTTTYNQNMATQSDAENGTNNSKWMSPLRVAQFVAKGVGAALQAHVDATGNVHGLTAADLDLENVANYRPTTQSDVDSNVNMDTTVTTATIVQYMINKVLSGAQGYVTQSTMEDFVTEFVADTANLPIATPPVALAGTANDALMTPLLTQLAIDQGQPLFTLNVVNTTADLNTCLAQSTWTDNIIDLVNQVVYTYSAENLAWSQAGSTVTPATQMTNGKFYINPVTQKAFKCTDAAGSAKVVLGGGPSTTVSSSAPPTDTTGYQNGSVWYQVS